MALLNLADGAYRAELRQQNELNYARFEAKLDQRISELRAELDKRFAELRVEMNERFARLEAKLAKLDASVGVMATRVQLEKGLREQTAMFFAAWGVLLASSIALWFR